MINVSNANTYFEGRTVGRWWREYSGAQKSAAILQAKRDLAKAIKRPLNENEAEYKEGDTLRDEYAVYEQALYSLLRDALPEGTGEALPPINVEEKRPKLESLSVGNGKWSVEALAWLCDKLTVSTSLA